MNHIMLKDVTLNMKQKEYQDDNITAISSIHKVSLSHNYKAGVYDQE